MNIFWSDLDESEVRKMDRHAEKRDKFLVYGCVELDSEIGEIDDDKSEWRYFPSEREAIQYAEETAQCTDAEYSDDDGCHGANTIVVMKWNDVEEGFDYYEIYYCGDRFDEEYDNRPEAKHSEWYRRFRFTDEEDGQEETQNGHKSGI
jgi:hypothetical protein